MNSIPCTEKNYNILVIGATGVGKTSLIKALFNLEIDDTIPTLGLSVVANSVKLSSNDIINFKIYETSSFISSMFDQIDIIHAILFCFSTESLNSIKELQSIFHSIQCLNCKCASNSGLVFVGTKFDLGILMSPSEKNRILGKISKHSRSLNIPVILTSAKSNIFIEEFKKFILYSAENDYSIQKNIFDSMEKNNQKYF